MIKLQRDNSMLINDRILRVWALYSKELGHKVDEIEQYRKQILNNQQIKLIQNEYDNNYNIIENNSIIGHLIEEVYENDNIVELHCFVYTDQIGKKCLKNVLEVYISEYANYNKIAITIDNSNKAKQYMVNTITLLGFKFDQNKGCYIKVI